MQVNVQSKIAFSIVLIVMTASSISIATFAQSASLDDPAGFSTHNGKLEIATYQGRKALRLTTVTQGDDLGIAMLPGSEFQDGTIEADVAVKITTPPGTRMPGFTGILFRAKADASEYEVIYLRPANALSENQSMRNHSVQYCAMPNYGWYKLRREWPFVYESYSPIQPETWMHLKIEVVGRVARVFLNGSDKPALIVDGLKGSNLRGQVGLWGYAGEESYFSNLRITPATPLPVKNGSDAVGNWSMRVAADAIGFQSSLELHRDGNKVSGTFEPPSGEKIPVNGTWRDGYVELSFPFTWPEHAEGAPGPTTGFMDGWFDGDSAKGRIRIDGRTDGMWMAQRKTEQSSSK